MTTTNSSSYANTPARLPALPVVRVSDPALQRFIDSVRENIEVRAGSRGDRFERAVTLRDLVQLGLVDERTSAGRLSAGQPSSQASGGVLVQTASGYTSMSFDAFANIMANGRLFKSMMQSLSDPARFADLPDQVQAILKKDIAAEAALRGADIRRMEEKIQSATLSSAIAVQEVTASLGASVAGVRETAFSSATTAAAAAGVVTQIRAAVGDPDTFTGAGVTLEQAMFGIASLDQGLYGQYTMKINAAGHIAGFGLAVEATGANSASSAFIIAADKFAIVDPSETIATPLSPPLARIPFGVDVANNTIYINGNVRINTGGPTLASLGTTSYRMDLDNEAFTVATSSTGTGGVYGTGTESAVHVMSGTSDDTAAWSFSIAVTGCTATINGGAGPVTGTASVVVRITNLTANNGQVVITATKSGAPTQTAIFKGSKALAGADGSPATVYSISSSVSSVKRNRDATYAPNAITFSILSQTGTSAPAPATLFWSFYKGTLSGGAIVWGSPITGSGTGYSGQTDLGTSLTSATVAMKFEIYQDAGRTILLDAETYPVVEDGTNNVTVYAYKRAASAPADNPGAMTWTFASRSFTTGMANGWTPTIPAGTDPLYVEQAIASGIGLTASISAGNWSAAAVLAQNGTAGSPGGTGAAGTRGTMQLYKTSASYTSGYANYNTDATAFIAAQATTNGSTPTTPIAGDTITFTNGTNYTTTRTWNGSAWVLPGVVIDGSLLVTGSVTSTSLAATAINGMTITGSILQTAATGARIVMAEGGTNTLRAYNAGGLMTFEADGANGRTRITGNSAIFGALLVTQQSSAAAVEGAGNSGPGVWGYSTSGPGVRASSLQIDFTPVVGSTNTATFGGVMPAGVSAATNKWIEITTSDGVYLVPAWKKVT